MATQSDTNRVMPHKSRLPSIGVLLSIVGLVLIVPFAVVATLQLRSANLDVDAAEQVQVSAGRLATLVRLGPAVNDELLAVGVASGQRAAFHQLPAGEGSLFDIEATREIGVEEAEARVDQLLADLGDPSIASLLDDARSVPSGVVESVFGGTEGYNDVRLAVSIQIEREVAGLIAAAGATEDLSISQSAQLATGAAELRTATVELDGLWALLEASQFVAPTIAQVPRLSNELSVFDERAAIFDGMVPPTGPIRDSWNDVRSSDELDRLLMRYRATAERFVRDGLNRGTTENRGQFEASDVRDALTLVARIAGGFADADVLDERLSALVDLTIEDLSLNAQGALDEAAQRRQITMLSVVAATITALLAILVVLTLISRPIGTLATVVDRIRLGDLNIHVPETGPREIRKGAEALNDALRSLRHVESQALALAEQRLDDAVLDDAAPGPLGASLQLAVEQLADSLAERDQIRTSLEHEASHDSLTKLPNRRALFEQVTARLIDDDPFGLLFIDLDDFKLLNDGYGHHIGDDVLRQVGRRLLNAASPDALVARLGGDEFVVVTETIRSEEAALAIAQRLQAEVIRPIELPEATIVPSVTIGLTVSHGEQEPADVLRDADLALHQAKAQEKSSIVVCDDTIRRTAAERTELKDALKRAIEENQFVLHYQEVVSGDESAVSSLEALIRWHRGGELVGPVDFIPVAEDSDLIIDIDCWVLNRVAEELATNPQLFGLRVAANISARHLSSGRLAQNVRSILEKHKINPNRLILEITETALLKDIDIAAEDLRIIRSLGVRVALDDFGTGYMSLAYLRSFPVDVLKIDKSFTSEIFTKEGGSIVQLIIDSGHLLSLVVVAEGVETRHHAEMLKEMGVDALQGYLFDKPKPLADLEEIPTAQAA